MKIKTPIYFSGVKCIKDGSPPTEDDYKHARISRGRNWVHCYREFRRYELEDNIEVEDIYYFCDLVRFFYKGYCCAIQEKYFVKVDDSIQTI